MTKLKKYTVDELMFHAFTNAEDNIQTLINSYNKCEKTPEILEYENLYNQLKNYRRKRWGRTHLEKAMNNCESKTILEILQMIEENKTKPKNNTFYVFNK